MSGKFALYNFTVGEVLLLKKKHPCGSYQWRVERVGAEISLSCLGCKRSLLMGRKQLEKAIKAIVKEET